MSGWIAVTISGQSSERHQEKLFSFFISIKNLEIA
jgi:hypothetical protein